MIMDNQGNLQVILNKDGVNDALHALSTKFNISDTNHLKNNWTAVEDLLLNFTVKRYSISNDFLFTETILQPFKNADEIAAIKVHLLN